MMEKKLNFVANGGVIRLPPGFRFHPTDEELIVHYLKRKIFSCPLPPSVITEVNVCKFDPWDLPGDLEKERYFFTTREVKYANGSRSNRATGSGYWKATGLDKKIVGLRTNQVVGLKKTLVFYKGKPPNGTRTDWIMHEYRLIAPETAVRLSQQRKSSTQNCLGDWVLCRIFAKKRNGSTGNEDDIQNIRIYRPTFIDFMKQEKSSSSSSASSGITEASSTGSESPDYEENSSCNSFALCKANP
ncbi:hypothetical protein GIB67_009445 [Kingdonia uniflora]|uniref:NAC domain-containing protein n=1 Tax=Kingdonia uniflora TaxID=39325 RepID=A0A7J7N374_9MAGN|nr:hypothetical protein GIB67_009445 [Kingdonia uniflora]